MTKHDETIGVGATIKGFSHYRKNELNVLFRQIPSCHLLNGVYLNECLEVLLKWLRIFDMTLIDFYDLSDSVLSASIIITNHYKDDSTLNEITRTPLKKEKFFLSHP